MINKTLLKKIEDGKRDAKSGETAQLISDAQKIYWAIPNNETDLDYNNTSKDAIINVNECKEIVTSEGTYKSVVCKQIIDSEASIYTQKGWVEASIIKEKEYFSAYNWNKFGFNIIEDGIEEYMYVVQDYLGEENSETDLVNALWYQMDSNNSKVISSHEIDLAYRSKEFQDFVSKIVCKHKNEWSYTPSQIRTEVAGFYDYFINEQPKEYRGAIDELKEGELDAIEEQVKKLMFWEEASSKTYNPPQPEPEPQATNKNSALDFRGGIVEEPTNLPTSNTPETTETHKIEQTSEKSETSETEVNEQEEKLPRVFPNTPNVYHFHPIAFVNHMKLIFGMGGDCESLIWGKKVSCQFRDKVIKIAEKLWGEGKKIEMANNLMAVFAWESGGTFKPDAPNLANSAATGLIQFMPDTAASLLGKKRSDLTVETTYNYWGKGKTLKRVKEFADMGDLEQLDYVEKYFNPLKGKDVEFVDFYLQVLYPASMGKPDGHVVFSKDGKGLLKTDKNYQGRINAYKKNDGFDTNPEYGNNDGKVTKAEIKKGIQKYLKEGQKYKNTCVGGTCTLNNNVKDGFDIDAAVSHLNRKAHPKSIHRCALYVREAIDAGGLLGLSGDAEKYYNTDRLINKGFTMIGTNKETITLKKGDIAAFKEQIGHKWGHIAMYNGNQWVSDFKQNRFWVSKKYEAANEYKIFRWE
ncbi:hypothetical protein [Olleya sp. Bg11-27]|uniref:lytic transglycosylase domain-containing protein n=1 Tax=Olleya sp. Bg11-27 TaxID=2058135 RepID=UPI000C307F6A|nr:hypothetical protein [Olleya sp. Bg11-27]AUC76030.1 hypothetical protein CW732_10305 [Olleya sp. Bg11-27]